MRNENNYTIEVNAPIEVKCSTCGTKIGLLTYVITGLCTSCYEEEKDRLHKAMRKNDERTNN